MSRTQMRHFIDLGIHWRNTHFLMPVFPVLVLNQYRDGAANRRSVPNTRNDLGMILFDLHPAASSISPLPALKFGIYVCFTQCKSRRYSFNDCN